MSVSGVDLWACIASCQVVGLNASWMRLYDSYPWFWSSFSTPSSIPQSGATGNSNSHDNTFVANFDAFAPTEPTSGRSSGAKTTATPSSSTPAPPSQAVWPRNKDHHCWVLNVDIVISFWKSSHSHHPTNLLKIRHGNIFSLPSTISQPQRESNSNFRRRLLKLNRSWHSEFWHPKISFVL